MAEHTYLQRLNEADILAPIANQQAEVDKFASESRKLTAEAMKLRGDRWFGPLAAFASIIAAIAAAAAAYVGYLNLARVAGHG